MTLENLNAAAQAMNDLVARMDGFVSNADADIATRQAAYDALASNLEGIVDGKLNQKIYVDAGAGDNSAAGTSGAPLATMQEAVGRLVPGSSSEIYLKRGETYVIDGSASVNMPNSESIILPWGDTGLAKPLISQTLYEQGGLGRVSAFGGPGAKMYFLNCHLRAAKTQDALTISSFSGVLTGYLASEYLLVSCDIELGDVDFVKTGYSAAVSVALRSCAITRQAGSTGKFMRGETGILNATATTLPAGESWADLVAGQQYAADGEVRNFITNVQL